MLPTSPFPKLALLVGEQRPPEQVRDAFSASGYYLGHQPTAAEALAVLEDVTPDVVVIAATAEDNAAELIAAARSKGARIYVTAEAHLTFLGLAADLNLEIIADLQHYGELSS
jgi:DNA-binding response OmpR family regulator